MKRILIFSAITLLAVSCRQQIDWMEVMPGSYSMEEQSVQQGDKSTTLKDLSQMKTYTDSHFMFTQYNPEDSSSAFGLGSYSASGDTIFEHSIYASSDSTFDTQPHDFSLIVSRTPKGYKQIINHIQIGGVDAILTEFYSRVADTTTFPLDGIWKETKSYLITNGDTTVNNRTQYKSFYKGYFMFGNTVRLDPNRTMTGMGYGSFKPTGEGKMEETDLISSYGTVVGNTFPVEYVLSDNDHFVQTVSNKDGSIGVEYYERMK